MVRRHSPQGSRGSYISHTLTCMDRVEADSSTTSRTNWYIPYCSCKLCVRRSLTMPMNGETWTDDHTTENTCTAPTYMSSGPWFIMNTLLARVAPEAEADIASVAPVSCVAAPLRMSNASVT